MDDQVTTFMSLAALSSTRISKKEERNLNEDTYTHHLLLTRHPTI
jgi:hypothetical protein